MHPGYTDEAMDLFLARVQQYSGLETREETDRLTRSSLNALADCVSSGQMADLASGLPVDLSPETEGRQGHAKAFDKRAFLDQISGGIGAVDIEAVEQRARAVLRTLREWAPKGESDNTIAQLPPALSGLFEPPTSPPDE